MGSRMVNGWPCLTAVENNATTCGILTFSFFTRIHLTIVFFISYFMLFGNGSYFFSYNLIIIIVRNLQSDVSVLPILPII